MGWGQLESAIMFFNLFCPKNTAPEELAELRKQLKIIMASITDIQAEVAAQKTIVASVAAKVAQLEAQVASLPDQATIDQIAADLKSNNDALAAIAPAS